MSEAVRYTTPLKGRLQILWYQGALPKHYPPHDGRLLGPQAVAERHVGAAVYLSDPTEVLVQRFSSTG